MSTTQESAPHARDDQAALDPAPDRGAVLASRLAAGLPGRDGFGDASLITRVPGSVDLGGGNPDPALLPVDLWRDAASAMTADPAFATSLKYVPAAGTDAFRTFLGRRVGLPAEQVVVTSGGIHGLALATLATVNPGDTVVVDTPVFPLFLRVLDLVGADVVPVPVGADGVDVEHLAGLLREGLRPAALFTVPTFHNPTGVVLSDAKARALVDLAEHYGFTIFSDDPYQELAFPGVEPTVAGVLGGHPHVIGVHTLAKTLGPAIRLGWVTVPAALADGVVRLRNRLDGQASGVLQDLALRILRDPRYAESVRAAGAAYATKEAALRATLEAEFGDALRILPASGGFFLWAHLARGANGGPLDSSALFDRAQAGGVTYQRGEWFGVPQGDAATRDRVRLSFSEPDAEHLRLGATRLARAWRDLA